MGYRGDIVMSPRMILLLACFMVVSSIKNIYEIVIRDEITRFECFIKIFIVVLTVLFIINYGRGYQYLG